MNESQAGLRRFGPAAWIAALALFIVIGGTATAASGLINGKKIKPGTVTAKQIKNRTITASKLNPSALSALKGDTGPAGSTGATGPAGTTGATGAAGVDGVVAPLSAKLATKNLTNGDQLDLLTFANPPAGTYLLQAKVELTSNTASNDINCAIWINDDSAVDSATVDPIGLNETVPMSLVAVTPVAGPIALKCTSMDGIGHADQIKLIAIPVQG